LRDGGESRLLPAMARRVAFITGASRGIGRAAAIALAEAGFDVAVTARTREEGRAADGSSLPGSIASTAAEVRARGREALPLYLDLLDFASIDAALHATLAAWEHVDLLLNNGIYTGTATVQPVLEVDLGEVERVFRANVLAPLHLTQQVLPAMLERGAGWIINMVSHAGVNDPPAAADQGGWGFAYAASKGALHRMVGVLAVEHAHSKVRFHNVDPGLVITEAMARYDPEGKFAELYGGAPMHVPAAVIAWLATATQAASWNGRTVLAQPLALELGLVSRWR
jgi:NAD(P)-dependent dehydrogenase (short-subunit alcohol dehydrogenase family)